MKGRTKFNYLGEKSGPVGLKLNTSSLEDGGDLLSGDGNVIVSEDEGSVAAGELGLGHYNASFTKDLAQILRTSTSF